MSKQLEQSRKFLGSVNSRFSVLPTDTTDLFKLEECIQKWFSICMFWVNMVSRLETTRAQLLRMKSLVMNCLDGLCAEIFGPLKTITFPFGTPKKVLIFHLGHLKI